MQSIDDTKIQQQHSKLDKNDSGSSSPITTSTSAMSIKDIFSLHDTQNSGYISVDTFSAICKDNQIDDDNLNNLIMMLDPYKSGFIDYTQFANGFNQQQQQHVNHNNNKKPYSNEYEADRNSNGSSTNDTFNEYDGYTDSETTISRHSNELIKQSQQNIESLIDFGDDFHFDSTTTNTQQQSQSKQKSPTTNPLIDLITSYDDDENESYEDYGTLDNHNTQSHQIVDSLVVQNNNNNNNNSSYSSSSNNNNNNNSTNLNDSLNLFSSDFDNSYLLKSKVLTNRRTSRGGLFHSPSQSNFQQQQQQQIDEHQYQSTNDTSEHEATIERLEDKIRELQNQIDQLKSDQISYMDKYSKLMNENSKLNERIHELEELSNETEKSLKSVNEADKLRFNDYIAKLNATHIEEKDNLIGQLHKYEAELSNLKEDISKYVRQINELNRIVDAKALNEFQLEEKFNNLKVDYQRLLKEKDLFKEDNEMIKLKSNQRIDALSKELNDLSLLNQQLKRAQTTHIQPGDETRIKELEFELKQLKNEQKQQQLVIQDLNAQLLRYNVDAGKLLLSQANVPSLAAEMETLSKDELMDKLKTEQTQSARYRDYIEHILSVVMEKNPEILEVKQVQVQSGTARISNNTNNSIKSTANSHKTSGSKF